MCRSLACNAVDKLKIKCQSAKQLKPLGDRLKSSYIRRESVSFTLHSLCIHGKGSVTQETVRAPYEVWSFWHVKTLWESNLERSGTCQSFYSRRYLGAPRSTYFKI